MSPAAAVSALIPMAVRAAEDAGPPEQSPLVISEFSALPMESVTDADGDAGDWVEILNLSEAAVSLAGWHLSDDASEPAKWAFPDVSLPAGGYVIIYASGKDRRDPGADLHTNFKLDGGGEYLALSNPDGATAHAFEPEFPRQREGLSFGLSPQGDFRFFSEATPGEANSDLGRCFVGDTSFSVDRGFFDAPFQVEITCATPGVTIRYTTDGNEPFAGTLFGGAKGEVYDGPITIDQTTVLRAYATRSGWEPSNVDTQTYLFLDDVIRQSPDGESPPGWPQGSVKGQRFDFGMDPDVVDEIRLGDALF